MSDPEYSLLQSISDNGGAVLVREVPADSVPVMQLLVDRGYVVRVGALSLARYEITDAGRVALSDHRQKLIDHAKHIAEKDAEQKRVSAKEVRKSRADWARFWIGVALGWLLGAFTPFDVWALIVKVVRWLSSLFR